MTPAGSGSYRTELYVGIGGIGGYYTGTVTVSDLRQPVSYRLRVEGRGKGGGVSGDATFTLTPERADSTLVSVVAEGQVAGVLGRVGQRLLGSGGKLLLNQFFAALNKHLRARVAAAADHR